MFYLFMFSFDEDNAVCAVLLDLSKAFNCVDIKILLNKLEYYGCIVRVWVGVFMQKFKKDSLSLNFKPYFTRVNKIHNHSTRFSETNYYIPLL